MKPACIQKPARLFSLAGLLLGLALAVPTASAGGVAPVDSTAAIVPDLVISSYETAPPDPARTFIYADAISASNPGSLADLSSLLPSARLTVNSRGDSHLMIRGAPERHVQTFLDGIPLNLPWDERVDLETVPITGAAQLEATRGMVSLLDGPGVLAGSVKVMTPRAWQNPVRTRINLTAGSNGFGRVGLQHITTAGSWHLVGAGNWQGRDAWPLPDSHPQAKVNPSRQNSDLSQYSLLLHGSRNIAGTGHLGFLATGWSGEKGVPAELHLGDDARFWRYPVRQRLLLGSSLNLPLNDNGTWDFDANISAYFFKQEIDPRGRDGWYSP